MEDSASLLERYRGGDSAAAEELFHRYVGRLVVLASARMSARLSRRVDPEDIVQSVYRSFFVGAREGRFTCEQAGDLWNLLAVITLNKIRQKAEYHSAQKRQMQQEQADPLGDSVALAAEALAREPSPDEELAVLDELEHLTQGLSDEQKRMVELRLQGYLIEEIAAEVGRSERTVRRVMDQIKARLEQRAG